MRNAHDPRAVDAELGQLLDRAGAVHDHAVHRVEHAAPEVDLVRSPPRQDVVRGEDDRPFSPHRLQPAQVVARQAQPLDVQHVGVDARDLLRHAPRAGHVLEALGEEPQPGARVAAQQPGAAREEHVVLAVAVRRRQLREREARGEQVDVVTAPCQRPGEAAIVGQRVADRIGEADPHDT